ncbi:hypothetical protein TrRE_jg1745 [Triparma retinervis]|uniref:Uncharacterized protein n=1 Tax=Triparma retinervis TaxID=2557542 RepID=A0A9W6Z5Q7_9STRA|nr:hypothetical protein TrRE_jg1745 [Triparma retinervis]
MLLLLSTLRRGSPRFAPAGCSYSTTTAPPYLRAPRAPCVRFETLADDTELLLRRVGAWEDFGASGWGTDGASSIFRGTKSESHTTGASARTAAKTKGPIKPRVDALVVKNLERGLAAPLDSANVAKDGTLPHAESRDGAVRSMQRIPTRPERRAAACGLEAGTGRSNLCSLFVVEGLSAKTFAVSGLAEVGNKAFVNHYGAGRFSLPSLGASGSVGPSPPSVPALTSLQSTNGANAPMPRRHQSLLSGPHPPHAHLPEGPANIFAYLSSDSASSDSEVSEIDDDSEVSEIDDETYLYSSSDSETEQGGEDLRDNFSSDSEEERGEEENAEVRTSQQDNDTQAHGLNPSLRARSLKRKSDVSTFLDTVGTSSENNIIADILLEPISEDSNMKMISLGPSLPPNNELRRMHTIYDDYKNTRRTTLQLHADNPEFLSSTVVRHYKREVNWRETYVKTVDDEGYMKFLVIRGTAALDKVNGGSASQAMGNANRLFSRALKALDIPNRMRITPNVLLDVAKQKNPGFTKSQAVHEIAMTPFFHDLLVTRNVGRKDFKTVACLFSLLRDTGIRTCEIATFNPFFSILEVKPIALDVSPDCHSFYSVKLAFHRVKKKEKDDVIYKRFCGKVKSHAEWMRDSVFLLHEALQEKCGCGLVEFGGSGRVTQTFDRYAKNKRENAFADILKIGLPLPGTPYLDTIITDKVARARYKQVLHPGLGSESSFKNVSTDDILKSGTSPSVASSSLVYLSFWGRSHKNFATLLKSILVENGVPSGVAEKLKAHSIRHGRMAAFQADKIDAGSFGDVVGPGLILGHSGGGPSSNQYFHQTYDAMPFTNVDATQIPSNYQQVDVVNETSPLTDLEMRDIYEAPARKLRTAWSNHPNVGGFKDVIRTASGFTDKDELKKLYDRIACVVACGKANQYSGETGGPSNLWIQLGHSFHYGGFPCGLANCWAYIVEVLHPCRNQEDYFNDVFNLLQIDRGGTSVVSRVAKTLAKNAPRFSTLLGLREGTLHPLVRVVLSDVAADPVVLQGYGKDFNQAVVSFVHERVNTPISTQALKNNRDIDRVRQLTLKKGIFHKGSSIKAASDMSSLSSVGGGSAPQLNPSASESVASAEQGSNPSVSSKIAALTALASRGDPGKWNGAQPSVEYFNGGDI